MPHPRYNSFVRLSRKLKAIQYKGGRCVQCGYDKCYAALEFHHRDPTQKEFSWSANSNKSWKTIMAELDKCDLLCANCHRETHHDPTLLIEYHEWVNTLPKVTTKICPQCQRSFRPRQNKIKFCSRHCFILHARHVDWPDDKKLLMLVESTSMSQVARELGVSQRAVSKRYHRIAR